MSENQRMALSDDILETVSGGQIQNTWDNNTSSGTIFITSKLTAPVVYTYTRYTKVNNRVKELLDQKYGDNDIITILLSENLISPAATN